MDVIWRKIRADLWSNRIRTLLVVLSIAVGVFAVGTTFGIADQLITVMDRTWQQDMPQHITMYLTTPISQSDIAALRSLPGVDDIAPGGAADARYRSSRDNNWHQAVVMMRPDYLHQEYEILRLDQGAWPQNGGLGMEHMQADSYRMKPGDTVTLEVGNQEQTFPMTGTIRHPYAPPPGLGPDLVFFFTDAQGMAAFGVPPGLFNTLLIRVTPYSPDLARQVASQVKGRLAQQNVSVAEMDYQDPTKHWGREQMDPMLMMMQVMAVASLILSTALVLNTITALIAQQTHQIGVLKAVGGTRTTILQIYLATVLAYGSLALLIALPLGAVVAFYSSQFILGIYDIPNPIFEISAQAVIFQLLAALVAPALAALGPDPGGGADLRARGARELRNCHRLWIESG